MVEKNPAFATRPDDPKDVSWGLTTADTCWRRGERSEALRWLRRAVEAASEAEQDGRALELAKVAADLATQIGSMAPPPDPAAPTPTIPRAGSATAPLVSRPLSPPTTRSPGTKDPAKKSDRKSVTNEGGKTRPLAAVAPKAPAKIEAKVAPIEPGAPSVRKRSSSRADKAEAQRSRTDEIDAWPTEVVPGSDLALEMTAEASTLLHLTEALRVHVWRDATGSVRVTALGRAHAPEGAIEATLVAADPTANLRTLFRTNG